MISKYNHKELTWVDIESPKEEEITHILEEYSIPSFIKDEIMLKSGEQKIDLDRDIIYISFNFPQMLFNEEIVNKIVFIVSDDFVITIHNEPIQALKTFSKEIELDIINEEKLKINNNKLLFAFLIKSLFINSQKQLVIECINVLNLKNKILNKNKKLKLLIMLSAITIVAIISISLYVFSNI